jgi:hypothetical protein
MGSGAVCLEIVLLKRPLRPLGAIQRIRAPACLTGVKWNP